MYCNLQFSKNSPIAYNLYIFSFSWSREFYGYNAMQILFFANVINHQDIDIISFLIVPFFIFLWRHLITKGVQYIPFGKIQKRE